jgi:hypothetical protein
MKQQESVPFGLDPVERSNYALAQQNNAADVAFEEGAAKGKNKPVFAESPGQFMDDLGNILGNTATGLVTDYLDLGAGLADVAVQTASAATGKGWDWNKVFDDSDNPWTQWRQNNFEAETQAGQVVSNVSRVASMLISLPKIGIKGLTLLPKLASGTKLPLIADAAGDAVKGLNKVDDFLKGGSEASKATTAAMEGLDFAKGTAAAKAAGRAGRNSWLQATYKEIAEVPEARTWFQSVQDSTKALTQLTREKGKIRTVAEALGWDAFVAFNVYGEGDNEFDETLTDMLANSGLPHIPLLKTDFQDAGVVRKLKQMAEGVATGVALNGMLDMARVYQFSRAFNTAGADEKAKIIKAFNAEADGLGQGLAGLLMPSAESLQAGRSAAMEKGARLNSLYGQLETERIGQRYQNDLLTAQLRNNAVAEVGYDPQLQAQLTQGQGGLNAEQLLANQQMVAGSQELLPGMQPAGLLPEGQVQQLPPGADPAMLPGGPEAKPGSDPAGLLGAGGLPVNGRIEQVQVTDLNRPIEYPPGLPGGPEARPPGAPPAGLLGAGGGELLPPAQQVQVTDLGPRPPEPVVSPQTIRNAFQADAYDAFMRSQQLTYVEGPDGVMRSLEELRGGVKQLMPRTRVDALEYFQGARPQANDLGVIPAADSVWMNFITNRGISEGWASIDPDTMTVKFNRKNAVELDQGDLAAKQAESMDQLNELNRYEEWLWNKELVNGSPQMRPEVQDNLAQKEARDAYDNWEAEQAAARGAEPDPARMDLERQAVTSGIEADQFDQAEELRLTEAELSGLTGKLDDATVVREYLGTTLDSVEAPQVVKSEVGRGWEVYANDGELLGRTTTKKAADKMAEGELARLRDATLAKARQLEVDATDDAMNVVTGDPVYESDLVGKIKLTDSQIDAIQKFSPSIQRQMRADWEKRTGGQAWINVNDLGGSQKTFEMTQGEMYDIIDGIKALLQTGEIAGPRARVLRNIADKMDTTMKLLEPEARAQRFANDIAADAKRFIDHGDYC